MEYTKTTDSGSQAGYTGYHWATCCTPPLYICIYIYIYIYTPAAGGARLARYRHAAAQGQSAGGVRCAADVRERQRGGRGAAARLQPRPAALCARAHALLPCARRREATVAVGVSAPRLRMAAHAGTLSLHSFQRVAAGLRAYGTAKRPLLEDPLRMKGKGAKGARPRHSGRYFILYLQMTLLVPTLQKIKAIMTSAVYHPYVYIYGKPIYCPLIDTPRRVVKPYPGGVTRKTINIFLFPGARLDKVRYRTS